MGYEEQHICENAKLYNKDVNGVWRELASFPSGNIKIDTLSDFDSGIITLKESDFTVLED